MRAEDLCHVGTLTIQEHEAWEARNKARNDLRLFKRKYQDETGEWFDREDAEPEDKAAFDPLQKLAKDAQRALTTARNATRRLAKKLRNGAP